MLLFLKLCLAHLIADFVLQPNWIARNKRQISRLALHSLIHFVTALVLINTALTKYLLAILLVLTVAHAVSDYIKARFTQRRTIHRLVRAFACSHFYCGWLS